MQVLENRFGVIRRPGQALNRAKLRGALPLLLNPYPKARFAAPSSLRPTLHTLTGGPKAHGRLLSMTALPCQAFPELPATAAWIFRGPGPGREKVAKRSPPGTCQKNLFGLYHCQAKPRAVNSAVECHPHTVEVTGSNPVPPTSKFKGLRLMTVAPFPFRRPNGAQLLQNQISQPTGRLRVPVFHWVAYTLRVMAKVACSRLVVDVLDVFPPLNQRVGISVSEIMESEPGQVRRFEGLLS